MDERLGRLLALANRPGTAPEGEAARAAAARRAAQGGRELVEAHDGTLLAVDEFHADLLHSLRRIADPPTPEALDG